ncbi:MAG: peptidylprolyl isomerase, partial [Nanoarchaeota archaeon]|nr:peptidylprolyl isomerase [Nanoarchaeota archaeon]
MGRKKLLKLQRKEERDQEVFDKKTKNKKIVISIIFLVAFVFAGYQVNIAIKNNKDKREYPVISEINEINKVAVIETSKGNIKLELYVNDAPKTVDNFIKLA